MKNEQVGVVFGPSGNERLCTWGGYIKLTAGGLSLRVPAPTETID